MSVSRAVVVAFFVAGFVCLAAAVVLIIVSLWVHGPDSARWGGTGGIAAFLAVLFIGAASLIAADL